MDTPSGYSSQAGRRGRPGGRRQHPPQQSQQQPQYEPQYDNTQTPYTQPGYSEGPPPQQYDTGMQSTQQYNLGNIPQFPGQQMLGDPMVANMAMQYGQNLADQGKDYVHKNLEKYNVSPSKVKYYFAVDTAYVAKKLGLLLFPFMHTDWSIKFNQDEPVAPRYEVNAPDLYIPIMAFVTYILAAGLTLGIQNRFSPEQLGVQSTSALVWLIIEMLVILLSLYVMNVSTQIKYLDLMAYCGYKYVGMIVSLIGGLLFSSTGYYCSLAWTSITTAFFLVRSLKFQIVSVSQEQYSGGGQKRLYLLLAIAFLQPVFMWWLTSHLLKL